MRSNLTLAVVAAAVLAGCAGTTSDAQIQTALSLTKDHFRTTATIKDDALDTVATVSTERGFQEKRGLLGVVSDDNFLRAFIDKKTGTTTMQVYQVIYYTGRSWNFFQTVNYEAPNGPQSRPVTIIGKDVNCTGSRYGGCTYSEHLGFEVDESLLRLIAASYQPGHAAAWKFKFAAKSGKDYNDGMLGAEVAGFLEAVDFYRASHGLPGWGYQDSTAPHVAGRSPFVSPPAPTLVGGSPQQASPATRESDKPASAPGAAPDVERERVKRVLVESGFPVAGVPLRFKQSNGRSYYEARGTSGQITQVICDAAGACRLRTVYD